ncbi:MAG: hypothetical protein JXA78_16270 [Anaerolineales bacterium]|nr:hypothetical protein [Anaerolineales bacterium]
MPDFPVLTCLALDKLLFYRRHDSQRARTVALRMRNAGVLRDPPVVTPLQGGAGRYVALDGDNGIAAMRQMGFSFTVAQVVEPDDPGLGLQNWNHAIWGIDVEHFLSGLRRITGLRLRRQRDSDQPSTLERASCLAMIKSYAQGAYAVCTENQVLEARIDLLNAIINSYRGCARLERTVSPDLDLLAEIDPSFSALVLLPKFKLHDLLRLAEQAYLLPDGIVSFAFAPRALHLNYPLDELAVGRPFEVMNEALQNWIQERIASRGVRYYAESICLFDE